MTSNDQYNQWRAKVQGTQIYRVVIQTELTTEVIRFSSCSCPFDGAICKHQVAVLYAIVIDLTDNSKVIMTSKKRGAPSATKYEIRTT